MNACAVCGGPMKPLMTSWFCPNDCDLNAKASIPIVPTGSAWDRVRRKMSRAMAILLDSKARQLSLGERPWCAFLIPVDNWFVQNRMATNEVHAAHTIIDVYDGKPTLRKCRDVYWTFEELPDRWTP